MKKKIFNVRNLYRTAILAAGLTTSYFLGSHNGFQKGYEKGKQEVKQELKAAGNIYIENCEHYMDDLKGYIQYTSSKDKEEIKRLQDLYRHTSYRRNDVMDLVDIVLDDNRTFR